ncbi:MAG: VapE family protein [Calothrix sp. MO_167.B42]|nr:VapE family protein [Calothrix sp. MO_167.B42]
MIITQETRQGDIFERPETIEERHWNEWLDSGVNEYIIARNIYSVLDSYRLDKLLNYNSKRRWKHSDDIVPAWVVSGVDPISGENTPQGIQAKPDNPRIGLNGKPKKYLGAEEYEAAPLFLDVEDKAFWQQVIQDKFIPVIITEGAKKAGCLLTHDYATISLPGVSTGRKLGRLHQFLKAFCGFGRTFYLCFDNDILVKRPVQFALTGLGRELAATGSKVMVIPLPKGDDKGVDDFIVNQGIEKFKKVFDSALTIEEWKLEQDLTWTAEREQERKRRSSKKAWFIETIKKGWGEFLKWNELTQEPELNGDALDPETVDIKVAMELDVDMTKDAALSSVRYIATQFTYHPIKQYLESLETEYPDIDTSLIDNLSRDYFGYDSEICNIYMKRFLIGAVGRAMEPGYKFDNAILLYGPEGGKKSTFWKSLFGADWFSRSMDSSNQNKDEKMLIHRYWGLEWSEFATVYKRKDIEQLKAFLAEETDSIRLPYERKIKPCHRRCVFVGTTNRPDVLQDVRGRNRRFWIIKVLAKEIDVEKVEAQRDRLWAAAYKAWKNGELSYIPEHSKEADLQDLENQQYKVKPPIFEDIESFLVAKQSASVMEIYDFLGIERGHKDRRKDQEIHDCFVLLGWERTEKRGSFKGSRPWLWAPKNTQNNFNQKAMDHIDHFPQKVDTVNPRGCPQGVHDLYITDPSVMYSQNGHSSLLMDQFEVNVQGMDHPMDTSAPSNSQGSEQSDPCDPSLFEKNKNADKNSHPSANRVTANKEDSLELNGGGHDPDARPPVAMDVQNDENRPIRAIYGTPLGKVRVIATMLDRDKWELELIPPEGDSIKKNIKSKSPKDTADKMKRRVREWYKQAEKPLKVGDVVRYAGFDRPYLRHSSKKLTVYQIDFEGAWVREGTKEKFPVGSFNFDELILVQEDDDAGI